MHTNLNVAADGAGHTVAELITNGAQVSPDTQVAVLAERFYAEPNLDALPLVEDGAPVGLASRSKILTTLAIRFGYALYSRKPISVIADMQPLIVRDDEALEAVLAKAMARNFRDIYDEILVVDSAGRYRGRLSVKRLVIEQSSRLAQSIAQRELALARTREMEEMTDIKSRFMAHVTHELRSPVHAIVGLAELMEMRFDKRELDEFPKFLGLLSSSSLNLRSIINNILDLAKIESGRMEVFAEEFILGELLDEVLETSRMLAGDKPLTLEVECRAPQVVLRADRVKLRQVLLNLASNAVKYTDRGIVVIAAEAGDSLEIAVRDTGIGIRKEDMEQLFGAFNQLEHAKSRRHSGTGLGLTITRELVQLLGGRISVDSTLGVGSRFDVSLPLSPTPLSEEIPAHDAQENRTDH